MVRRRRLISISSPTGSTPVVNGLFAPLSIHHRDHPMSDQHIGRRRTFKVIDADGEESSTTVETVGLQKKKAKPAPVPEPSAAVSENSDSAESAAEQATSQG